MKSCGCTGSLPCGCCAGTKAVTPVSEFNRPGLSALTYRTGTHATFLETMEAALSRDRRLDGLSTRETSDTSIALLDAWATVGDVLTFYQERVANEGYLATATERRSVMELGNLIGYHPRPGVSASVFLAYTLEKGMNSTIGAGALVRSTPNPGETQQAFETAEDLDADAAWNNLQIRLTQPSTKKSIQRANSVYLQGLVTSVRKDDPLFVRFASKDVLLYRVAAVEPDAVAGRTRIGLEEWGQPEDPGGSPSVTTVDEIAAEAGLLREPSLAPPSQYNRPSALGTLFHVTQMVSPLAGVAAEAPQPAQVSGPALATLRAFRPAFRASLATALANATVTPDPVIEVYTVTRTAAFGYNAGPQASVPRDGAITTSWSEWDLDVPDVQGAVDKDLPILTKIDLEKEFEKVTPQTIVAVQQGSAAYSVPDSSFGVAVSTFARASYGLSGKVTRLVFKKAVLKRAAKDPGDLGFLRPVKVFLSDALLPLAEQPIPDPVCGSDGVIELNALYEGLTPGKWIILDGEREDTSGTSGVRATELLLIGDVQHRALDTLPGARIHTFIETVAPSSYCYKRATLKIYGNVVKATNGETRKEVLGSGDASIPFQSFALKQPPVTFLPAPTATGAASTLKVYVNDVAWHEVDSPVGLAPYDRRFFTTIADDGATSVIFGDGMRGMRVPTGVANLKAAYRNGIGKGGNVQAGQLNILGSKPAGVKEVVNPLRASGGADQDPRDRIRENAPLTVTALDRLVSVPDYAHFSQTFAAIGKASSVALSDGQRQLVHVTIAGIDDIAILPTSDLYLNLRRALHRLGDPSRTLRLDVRFAKFLVVQAGVKLNPDYQWEVVAPQLTAALLDAFSFERRKLGQNAYLSEVTDVLQRVPGVEYVDVDQFGALTENDLTPSGIAQAIAALTLAPLVPASLAASENGAIKPAEIAYFSPDVPAAIALNQLGG